MLDHKNIIEGEAHPMAVTARIEDYLEAVFKIEISGRSATVTELAARLRVTKATVTAILKRRRISISALAKVQRFVST